MALQPLSPAELAETPTVLASFMGQAGRRKTVGELLRIYRERARRLAHDDADDLRIGRFIDHMAGEAWRSDVVIRVGEFGEHDDVLVVDGIHRGIAYLACLEEGVSPERLPALCVDC